LAEASIEAILSMAVVFLMLIVVVFSIRGSRYARGYKKEIKGYNIT
tara:strand:- start:1314 stop:1451 length:138 start_codon:yes stop_codon:yes gene_type:complete